MNPPIYESEHGMTTAGSIRAALEPFFLCSKNLKEVLKIENELYITSLVNGEVA